MLVLQRKLNEDIFIGEGDSEIVVRVVGIRKVGEKGTF